MTLMPTNSTHELTVVADRSTRWQDSLAAAIRDPEALLTRLQLPAELLNPARRASQLFPLMVTESFVSRMRVGDPNDPLLRQVLPLDCEFDQAVGYTTDALQEADAHKAPGVLQKYAGRVLLILTGACAINCRYCFRRHYPYGEEPRRLDDWQPAIAAIAADESIHEVILSGGDPLLLTDQRLGELIQRIEQIEHVKRLRIHSRLPIVLPNRVTDTFLNRLQQSRLTPIMVVHANHPAEIVNDCSDAIRRLVTAGITTLNQAVLLKGVNDQVEILTDLCERLVDLGAIPYYIHQLDRVIGTSHFEVPDSEAIDLVRSLRSRLPGYAVPRLSRETPGIPHKEVLC